MTLLDEAITAHGGRAAFEALGAVSLTLTCTGIALPTRGRRGALDHVRVHAALDRLQLRYDDWPRPGQAGIVDGWTSRIEDEDGRTLAERHGRRRKLVWDHLNVLHFAGYALWSYLTAPFLYARADIGVDELPGRRLRLTLPKEIPSHSARQTVHLDGAGRIARLDYTAEVFGRWASAANLCLDYETVDGVVIPSRRRVVPRAPGGLALPGPTLVGIRIDDLQKDRGPGLRRGPDPVLH